MSEPRDDLAGLIEVGLHAPEADCVQCENARRAAARILAAGWRPPLSAAPRLGREDLGRRVSDVAVKWSREHDDRPGATATWETLTPELQELYMRVGEALFGLGMTWSPAPPAPSVEVDAEATPDGWYPAAMREHDRANAAELDRNATRASS